MTKKKLTEAEKIKLLRQRLADMAEPDQPYSENAILRKRGDLLRLTQNHTSVGKTGDIVMAVYTRTPDSDGEYYVIHIDRHGNVDTDYIHYDSVESYITEDQKRLANVLSPKRRKMNLTD